MNSKQQIRLATILVVSLIVIDQVVKILVKTNMQLGQEFNVIGDWFRIHFIENRGIAFGMLTGEGMVGFGKIMLTLLRLCASIFLGWFIVRCARRGARTPFIAYLSLFMAGAVGNVIDSCFYGLIFNESYYQIATLFPPEGGYGTFLQGRVVDMFYFPLFEFDWPQWMPFFGGEHFEFFNAIFNVADSCITVAVIWFIIDQLFVAPKEKNDLVKEKSED